MKKEYEYFGHKIIEHAKGMFIASVKDKSGEEHQLTGRTIDEVKERINWFLHKQERDEVIERLCEDFDMTRKAAEFVINMTASFHSCDGAAVRRIGDYLNEHNYC
jgi:hypothetical protein